MVVFPASPVFVVSDVEAERGDAHTWLRDRLLASEPLDTHRANDPR